MWLGTSILTIMAGVRNVCFARGVTPAPGFVTVYTVPPERELIFKSVWAQATAGGATDLHVYIRAVGALETVELTSWDLTAKPAQRLDHWTVLNPGDQVLVNGTGGPAIYWMSGAVLPGSSSATSVLEGVQVSAVGLFS